MWLIAVWLGAAPWAVAQPAGLLPPPVGGAAAATPAPAAEILPAPADANSTPWHPPEGTAIEATAEPPATLMLDGVTTPIPGQSGVIGDQKTGTGVIDDRPPTWYEKAFLLVPAPWDSGVELGLNGSAGSQDSLSLRTGGYIKRKSRFSKLDLSSYYNRTSAGGDVTQNNAQFDVRNDWLLDEKSPWTLFVTNNVFYDEFKAFDVQTNADTGVGYRFFHQKELELIGRVGGGVSREFGGPDDRWVPESLFGVEYNQQIWATQKVYAKVDYFPEWDQIGEYRVVADTGWEVLLVQPSNLSLKVSATDRYDSTPNGAEPHLVNYSVLLLLKL